MEKEPPDSEQNEGMGDQLGNFQPDNLEDLDVEKFLIDAGTKDYRKFKNHKTSVEDTQSTKSGDSDEKSSTLSGTGTDEGRKDVILAPRDNGGGIDDLNQKMDEIFRTPSEDSENKKNPEEVCSMENEVSPSAGQRNTTEGTPGPREKQPKSRTGNRGIPYLPGLKNSVGKDVPKRDFYKCFMRRLGAIIMLILHNQLSDLDLLEHFIVDLKALLRYHRGLYTRLAKAIGQATSVSSAFVKRHFASEEARRLLEMTIEHDCMRSAEYLERTYNIEFRDVTVLQFKRRFQKTPSEELDNSDR